MNKDITDPLESFLRPMGVEHFGVCRYEDCLPLLDCRAKSRVPQDARSVLVLLYPYYTGEYERRNVARYAVPNDYHQVAGDILEELAALLRERYPGEEFTPFVDNSPIREVKAARLAGLGVVGLHGQLINREYGGYVFIGEIVATVELPISPTQEDACLSCRRCLAACPTGALSAAGLNRSLCRSAITQKKGALTPWEREQVRAGGMAWGCDLCVDACPMNRQKKTPIGGFQTALSPLLTTENLSSLIGDKPYGYRGETVLRRNLELIGG